MSCLSRNGETPVPVVSLLARTYRPGKFHDAPLFWVDRKTTSALDVSALLDAGRPRLNSWQLRYALPLLSHATEVSPPPPQYCLVPPKSTTFCTTPRVKLVG